MSETNGSHYENQSRGKRPVHEVRFGLIKAAVWENQTKVGARYSVTFCRLFKNGDVWKESTRFGRDDLPLVAKVADLAHSWIFGYGRQHESGSENGTSHSAST